MSNEIKEVLSFDPKAVVKRLLEPLSERSRDILKKRYGLESAKGLTLEAIGRQYSITRERVRQIEEFSLNHLRQSPAAAAVAGELAELESAMADYGGVVHEQEFLNHLSKQPMGRNQIHFLLVVGGVFAKRRETDHFYHRWTIDENLAERVEQALRRLAGVLAPDDLLPEEKMLENFSRHLEPAVSAGVTPEKVRRWLTLSKEIGLSPIGEWGLSSSPNVRMRGVRDYAFLILRDHGEPMHFRDVAQTISDRFSRRANTATCHNELIKDKRFVLVGRGIYALSDWGYQPGIVRDVIKAIIEKHGPLTEAEVIRKVLDSRQVKPNTVLVNLKNPRYFRKDSGDKYIAAS